MELVLFCLKKAGNPLEKEKFSWLIKKGGKAVSYRLKTEAIYEGNQIVLTIASPTQPYFFLFYFLVLSG